MSVNGQSVFEATSIKAGPQEGCHLGKPLPPSFLLLPLRPAVHHACECSCRIVTWKRLPDLSFQDPTMRSPEPTLRHRVAR